MKKLYLIGDSIRMGYCEYVKAALEGKAEVHWHSGNARFAEYVLYSIGDWEHKNRVGEDTACVHWNTGLHDVIRTAGEEPLTPPEIYGYYIERICKRLKNYYLSFNFVLTQAVPHHTGGHSHLTLLCLFLPFLNKSKSVLYPKTSSWLPFSMPMP